jgi:hypothetical protein
MKRMLPGEGQLDDVFAAAKEANRQFVADGKMIPETLRAVSRELLHLEQYMQSGNQR